MSEQNKVVIHDVPWTQQLEKDYEDYIDACTETLYDEDDSVEFKTISGEPFCGCSTCYTREQLVFLIPRISEGLNEGKISIEE
jgi:hypothetical protein